MPLKVVAKDVASSVCEKGVEQMTLGVTDAVIRKLLVEVCRLLITDLNTMVHKGIFCSQTY